MIAVTGALSGVRVVEFGAYAAGPHVGKLLANFGARVVHVESRSRPDGFREEYPPFKDRIPGPDRGACFAYFNDSKYSITVDLKQPSGTELGRRLLGWADIVIENMRPGVMARLGLGFTTARAVNSDVVMLSSCNMGQSGPRAHTPGFGTQLSALAGFCGLTGEPDQSPMLLYGPYIDFIASAMGTAAVLSAYHRARSTGEPAWIDLAQYESGLHFLAGAIHEYHASGHVADRRGNSDPAAAPHDVYPCTGDGYVAISCWSDEEFQNLCAAIGQPDLAQDVRFIHAEARRVHAPALDAVIGAWTRSCDPSAVAEELQAAGVRAYAVNDVATLLKDPQLVHRRAWRVRRHAVLGEHAYGFPAFDLSRTPGDVTAPAPLLGEHNEIVCRELLKLSAEEYADCVANGAFG